MDPRWSSVPLPLSWPDHVKSAFLHALGMAHMAMTHIRGRCTDGPAAEVSAADSERRRSEIELLREELRIIVLPFCLAAMRAELVAFVHWYDAYRPHQSFGGRTPAEVYAGLERVDRRERTESTTRLTSDKPLQLEVTHLEGRKHLPIVELRAAA